ncbi:MAG: hypothetical protein ABJM43_13280 [Paracoccaceae bacterium]
MTTLRQISMIARRSQATLLGDAFGAAALMALLFVALHIPSFV